MLDHFGNRTIIHTTPERTGEIAEKEPERVNSNRVFILLVHVDCHSNRLMRSIMNERRPRHTPAQGRRPHLGERSDRMHPL